jgi:large subunit ribosomal protein L24
MRKIRTGDTVHVIAGENKGTEGKVLRVETKTDRVVVEGVNIVKKHQRAQQAGRRMTQAGVIEFEAPIHVSNVMLVCPHTGKPTRVGIRINAAGKRVRFSHASNQDIED